MSSEVFPVDENDADVMVSLDLDNGVTLDCEIITIFDALGREYIALMPVDADGNPVDEDGVLVDEEDGAIILLYRYSEDEDGTPSLDNIESDEEYDEVAAIYDTLE